jgi:hypothetical protein
LGHSTPIYLEESVYARIRTLGTIKFNDHDAIQLRW